MSARSPSSIGSSRGSVTRDREISLDPADAREWEELRALGHRMVDDMLEYLRTARERPVWRPVPADVRARLSGPAPREPTPAETVYEAFKRDVLPYPTGNTHPRFWGWVIGTGTPLAMLADMLASGMNPQVAEYGERRPRSDHPTPETRMRVAGRVGQDIALECLVHGLGGRRLARHRPRQTGAHVGGDGTPHGPLAGRTQILEHVVHHAVAERPELLPLACVGGIERDLAVPSHRPAARADRARRPRAHCECFPCSASIWARIAGRASPHRRSAGARRHAG